jgi:malonate transporter
VTIHVILSALAPVFFVLALGYFAGRWGIVENHHVDGLNALVMDFALPASLLVATASASRAELIEQGPLFAVFGGVMLILYLLWYGLARLVSKTSRAEASVQALTIAFPNLAGVGLPLVSAVLGPKGAVPFAVALAAGSILVSPLTLILLELYGGNDQRNNESSTRRMLRALRRALTKPVVLAPALGILFALSGLTFDPIVHNSLALIGQAAGGVALFLTGLILSAEPFRPDWKVAGATAAADVIRPLLAVAVVAIMPVAPETAKVAILLSAAPSGFFGILFAVNYKMDSAEVGSMVTGSTVLSIVPLAIAIAVLFP